MKNYPLRLSTRLFFAFGAVVLLSLVSSGIALMKLKRLQENLTSIVSVNDVKAGLNEQMSKAVSSVSQTEWTLPSLSDIDARRFEHAKVSAFRASYDRARAKLETFAPSPAAKAIRARIDAAAIEARALNNKVMDLAMSGHAAEATALLVAEAGPATQQWQSALDENIALQTKTNEQQYAQAEEDYAAARQLLIGSGVFGTLVAVVLTWVMVRSVVSELGGEPSEVAALANAIADADFGTPVSVRPGDTKSVVSAMARMQAALTHTVGMVRISSRSVATASAEIAQGNLDLSQRTEQQASALEETAASMEQLSSTVQKNADNAAQANRLAVGASDVAIRGGEVVSQVVETMQSINDSSRQIADIISVIDGITFQTNILALNAAVEAARAGEQGRGFAVVASEVRSLAMRSADAAREIKTLIDASVERVEHGSNLVDRAGRTMTEVVESIQRVTELVGEISVASNQQSAGVSQVGGAIVAMDRSTQQNAALVEETAAAAESLKMQALQLVDTVSVFRIAGSAA